MRETRKIVIGNSKEDKIASQFGVLIDILLQIPDNNQDYDFLFDLSTVTFAYPLVLTSIAALKTSLEKKGCKVEVNSNTSKIAPYLDYIHFPTSFDYIETPDWQQVLTKYKTKTYLPICLIHTGISNERVRNDIESIYTQIMQTQLTLQTNIKSAISFIISEFIDNIDQHSMAPFGYIMVQHYPKKGFLQICIIDRGDGILNSYIRNGFTNIETHSKALEEALNGRSTKIDEKGRGFGISTSRKMLVKGLGGEFFLMTGNALFVYTKEHEQIIELDVKQAWDGTILAIGIPTHAPKVFNIIDYLES